MGVGERGAFASLLLPSCVRLVWLVALATERPPRVSQRNDSQSQQGTKPQTDAVQKTKPGTICSRERILLFLGSNELVHTIMRNYMFGWCNVAVPLIVVARDSETEDPNGRTPLPALSLPVETKSDDLQHGNAAGECSIPWTRSPLQHDSCALAEHVNSLRSLCFSIEQMARVLDGVQKSRPDAGQEEEAIVMLCPSFPPRKLMFLSIPCLTQYL